MSAVESSPGKSHRTGFLGDTAARDYTRKLQLFNRFAEPELRAVIADLGPLGGMRVLDAGCGCGAALSWLCEAVGAPGQVIGCDLALPHLRAAAHDYPACAVAQADLMQPPFADQSFDLVWCMNALNHLHDPASGVRRLAALLRPGGRLVIVQTGLLPDMYFAWDAVLERSVTEAVRAYYRDRYQLDEERLAAIRCVVGWLRAAGFNSVEMRTQTIERISPVDAATAQYLVEAVFQSTWGERLRRYLPDSQLAKLARLCDPDSAEFALRRIDFHYLQSLSVACVTVRASIRR